MDYDPAFDFVSEEMTNDCGSFIVCEYNMADILPEAPEIALQVQRIGSILEQPLESLVFMDLETCGLSNTTAFLVGTMQLKGNEFIIKQYFARDYREEKAVMTESRRLIENSNGLITFNGKTFDMPFLKDRMRYFRLEFDPPRVHLDLLHPARRKWRGILPNCKLQTLEEHICSRKRKGDVPGSLIPGMYHEYVRCGDIEPLIPVFRHNVMDIMTMAELLPHLC
jgi:uncharacterized protein YprB with RNaseH-like and TPR domain